MMRKKVEGSGVMNGEIVLRNHHIHHPRRCPFTIDNTIYDIQTSQPVIVFYSTEAEGKVKERQGETQG